MSVFVREVGDVKLEEDPPGEVEVCVFTDRFPTLSMRVSREETPRIPFTESCSWLLELEGVLGSSAELPFDCLRVELPRRKLVSLSFFVSFHEDMQV